MGQDEINEPKIYFKENRESFNDKMPSNDIPQKEKVKLFFSLEECIQDTNYQIKLVSLENNNSEILFETEKSEPEEDNIIEYDKTYTLTYFFEKEQILIFKIVINELIIEYKTTLGCIVGSRNSILSTKISEERKEKIKIQATKIEFSSNDKLKIQFHIKKDNKSKKSLSLSLPLPLPLPFHETKHQFLFKISSKEDLYRSEIVTSEGYLKPVIIPIHYLTPSFNIIFYNLKEEVLISFSDLTYEKVLLMDGSEYPLYYSSKSLKKVDLLIESEIITNTKTFLDHVKQGININLSIAIDFSKPNENLHKLYNDKMNRYEEAIKYCGDILGYYNQDQQYPVWGFGADNIQEPFHKMCFPINFKENPNVEKIEGVIKEYRNCLNKITFAEEAEFSPVITNFIKMIEKDIKDKKHTGECYYILLLLTKGKYVDREKTIDQIVKGSKLPMSIIIVGLEDLKKESGGEFDIVYMIDATGSMGNYLRAAKDQCINISNELQDKFKDYNFRFGGVFYRDPIDCPKEKNEIIDLTDDVISLKFFISNVKAVGGGDEAEDWAGGYDLAINKIKWRKGLKLIIHICDADGHGKRFTNSEDNHPDEEIKVPPLIEKCVQNQIKVYGFNINKGANTSFNEYKKIYESIDKNRTGLYNFKDFEETENLAETFKNSVIEAATFAAMVELDGDNEPLVNSIGEKWERHIVKFVPYDKYKDNLKLLAEKVLEEIPNQVVQYYNNKYVKDAKKDGFFIVDNTKIE